MADMDEHEQVDYDDNEARVADDNTSLALANDEPEYQHSADDEELNIGQSRRILQRDRVHRENASDPGIYSALFAPYVKFSLHADDGTEELKEQMPCDGFFEPEVINDQNPVVEVIRGKPFQTYPPAVKAPLTVEDYCRVTDSVIIVGGDAKTRAEHNLLCGNVIYPGRCLNESAIETTFEKPLPPLAKSTVDTIGQLAIVGWLAPSDDKVPTSKLLIRPTSYCYAAVRKVSMKISDLLKRIDVLVANVDSVIEHIEHTKKVPASAVTNDLKAAKSAREMLIKHRNSVSEHKPHFSSKSSMPDAKPIKQEKHESRHIVVYVYDIVPDLLSRSRELMRPAIEKFKAEREYHARRLWIDTTKATEAIGIRLECQAPPDKKTPRFVATITLLECPISPILASLPAPQRDCQAVQLPQTTPVGSANTDLVVINEVYETKLKAMKSTKVADSSPTVVVAAPTKEAMSSVTASETDKMLASLNAVGEKAKTSKVEDHVVAAKQPAAATKRKKEDDSEETTAKKAKTGANKTEEAKALEPPVANTMAVDTPAAPPATKAMYVDEHGVLRLQADTTPKMDKSIPSVKGRLLDRLKKTTVALKGKYGEGPIGRVTLETEKLDAPSREQLAQIAQFLEKFKVTDKVLALLEESVAAEESNVSQDDDNDEEERKAAEKKRKEEEEAARKAAEEKKRKEEEARKAAEEKKRKEEEARKAAAEKKRKEEEARKAAAEKKRKEEEARKLAEEEKKRKVEKTDDVLSQDDEPQDF